MKKRAGFKTIVVDGKTFQYAVAEAMDVVLYNEEGKRIVLRAGDVWDVTHKAPDDLWVGQDGCRVWRGKHGDRWLGKKQITYVIKHLVLAA